MAGVERTGWRPPVVAGAGHRVPGWPVLPGWVWGCGVVWAGLLVGWVPVVEAGVSPGGTALSHGGWQALAWWAGAALGGTAGWGALLGHRRAWVPLLASAVTAPVLLLGCYLALVLTWPPVTAPAAAGDGDTAAAAGLVVLALPALLATALPLGIGAGAGWCVRLGGRWRSCRGPGSQAAPKS